MNMNSTCYGYYSSDSVLTGSNRTSVDSNENLLSVNCGPTMINSYISFGGEQLGSTRQEMLQQIANRVQRDSLGCEDKLVLARCALQADTKRMESGIQFQNEAEVAGYLIECENLLRQQLVDVQAFVDGKYYQADQLVQRVAALRDELLALRNEYSSLYSKGRMIASDQTQLMISGISQSLNSGFSQSLNPVMNSTMSNNMASMSPTSLTPSISGSLSPGLPPNLVPGLPSSLTTNISHGFNSHLTPITATFTPNVNPSLIQNYATGMNSNALHSLKLMQVRKPLLKSSLADQNLTEEEVNIKFIQDLSKWLEETQIQLERGEWGSDLSSIEIHLENHKNFHGVVEEFETSLKEAKMSELQMTGPLKSSYADLLNKVESSYSRLLKTSRGRQNHLDSLHNFVTRATRELIWLNEKEEEEVAYDWSDRNQNIPAKRDYHADLMRELDHKEEVIKSVQDTAEQMLLQNHPARSTIEAYKAAMQTQWNWILQLCSCVEQHVRQNTAYFEYFSDAKDAAEYLKSLKDSILRKYSCDKSTSVHKLEDLVQESMEEKEQLLQYKSKISSLVGKAKAIVQLKPRNPDNPLKASIPIRAICDYRQIEITIYKDDECVLASNSHRAKWKVISPTGNEAMVPSVCFTVPPPNKEAVDSANRIEQMYQSVLSLWHESHINMKSMVSWHYLMSEIEAIRASKVSSIKTLLPGEHQQVLSNLKARFDEFLEDSQESKMFSVSDIGHLEREVNVCKLYYEDLLKSAEREEQEESIYNLYTSEIRNFRLRLESCEERLIRQIRTPLDRDDLRESALRISEQEKLKRDLDHLKVDLSSISDKCEEFFSQAAASPATEALRSELSIVVQSMNQVYSMSSIYLEKLKTINLVLKNTQGAESLVKTYETKLCEEDVITADRNTIDKLIATLKQWRSEVDEKREVFHALEDELQKAKSISDQMFKVHKERDIDFDWHKEKADQIAERWQNVHSQIENRLRDLVGISKYLKYYKECYLALDSWITHVEEGQSKLQDGMPDSKALSKLLDEQKILISEIGIKQSKMDECQKYSEQYSLAIKDYELQLMTYRALVDSHQKSPMKRRRFQSSSDVVVQEYMDLRTRYTALMTLISQFIKFSGETLKRLEDEETLINSEHSNLSAYPELAEQQNASADENRRLLEIIQELELTLEEVKQKKFLLEQELPKVKTAAEIEIKKHQRVVEELTVQKTKAENDENENEIKQYKAELSSLQIQKAAADEKNRQLRNQLDDTHNILQQLKTDIEQKNLQEQNYILQLRDVERKLYQSQDKAEEMTQDANDLKKIRISFEEELKVLQQDKVSLDHMLKMQKVDYNDVREKLKACQEELRQKEISERNSLQNRSFLEEELTRKKQEVDALRKQIEGLTHAHAKAESSLKMLNIQISGLQQEKFIFEQRSQSRSGEVESLREQLMKTQDELHQIDRLQKDDQQKMKKLQDELTKSNQWANSLKIKLDDLTKSHNETEVMLREVKTVYDKTIIERNNLIVDLDTVKSQLDLTKEQMRATSEQLQKQSRGEYETQHIVKRLEEELAKSKNSINEINHKCGTQNLTLLNSEKEIRNLKAELNSFTVEKHLADQKLHQYQTQLQDMTLKLKKAQDDLHKKIVDDQLAQKKLLLYQEESAKYRNSTEEFRKKLEMTLETSFNTESNYSSMKLEFAGLKQEKAMMEEKTKLMRVEFSELKERLQICQEQLNLERKSGLENVQRCRKLEEELEVQKSTVKNFKQKVDLQRQEHINQLKYLQSEIQQNNSIRIPFQKNEFEVNSYVISSPSSPRHFEGLNQKTKGSPILRRKLDSPLDISSPVFNSTLTEEKKHMDGYVDSAQEEHQVQLSRIKQSLDVGDKGKPFTEYVTQTSTEFQISIDNPKAYKHLTELEAIKDKSLQNAIQTLRIEEEKIGKQLGKFDQPMEIVKSKQYVEVTTVKQEKEFLLNNEDEAFEERNVLEGFSRADLPKMGYKSSSYKSYAGSETSLSDSSSTDDRFIFQGLRKNVSAKQMVEAKILDAKTMEQLELGQTTVQDVQKELDTYLSKATAIAGLYLESSRERVSFGLAAKKGIINKGLALEYLEAQVVTGFIIDPSTGKKYSVDEAISCGIADREFKEKLLEAEKAVLGYIYCGKKLSVFEAIEARLLERQKGKRILEAQIATGGVIDPVKSIRIPPEVAVLKGLLNHSTIKFLHEPAGNVKGFHFPTNKKSMYYSELLQLCVFDVDSKTFLLPIGERRITAFSVERGHKICIVDVRSGKEMTRFEAFESGLLDKKTYADISQYECQWESSTVFDSQGNLQVHLTDHKTGRQFNLEEAVSKGKIDKSLLTKFKEGTLSAIEVADILVTKTRPSKDSNSPIAGFWIYETNERVSVFKALKRNIVDRVTAFRCLEAQVCTGGIIDPSNGKKYNVSDALHEGLIDDVCAKQIQQCEAAYTGVTDPTTKALLSAGEAMKLNLLYKEIGYRCLEYQYVTGGLIDPRSHSRLSLEDAIKKGIVDAVTATKLKDNKSYGKNLTNPKTKRKLSYKDALEKTVYDCHTGLRLMEAPLPLNVGIPSLYFASQ
ncbi:dystonin isoform X6 [Eleutherodactylus coqui]|uniref:dystonin isoform X6 n=1 Tax=Eleutherodactylus coqui TaxID=57060 RepID=UPI003462DC1B